MSESRAFDILLKTTGSSGFFFFLCFLFLDPVYNLFLEDDTHDDEVGHNDGDVVEPG